MTFEEDFPSLEEREYKIQSISGLKFFTHLEIQKHTRDVQKIKGAIEKVSESNTMEVVAGFEIDCWSDALLKELDIE